MTINLARLGDNTFTGYLGEGPRVQMPQIILATAYIGLSVIFRGAHNFIETVPKDSSKSRTPQYVIRSRCHAHPNVSGGLQWLRRLG